MYVGIVYNMSKEEKEEIEGFVDVDFVRIYDKKRSTT